MTGDDRIEAALRQRPSDESQYQDEFVVPGTVWVERAVPTARVRPRARGPRALAAAVAVAAIACASALIGYSGLRPAPADTSTPQDSPLPEMTLSLEQTARSSVDDSGAIASGGVWVIKGSALIYSTDGGQSWRAHSIPREGVNSLVGPGLFMLDADHAWKVTDIHTIYRTADGGASWAAASLPDSCGIWFGMDFVDASVGYVVCLTSGPGIPATVMRTEDGGATWVAIATGAATGSGSIGSVIEATDERTIWATSNDFENGSQAMLAVSRDGGATWRDSFLPGIPSENVRDPDKGKPGLRGTLPTFTTPDAGSIRVGGDYFVTTDGGRTWIKKLPVYGDGALPRVELSATSWVAYDDSNARILHTSDAGAHWTAVQAGGWPAQAVVYGFAFTDQEHGTVKVYDSHGFVLLVTADGGATWTAPDLRAAAAGLTSSSGDDQAIARVTVESYERARIAGDVAAQNRLLARYSQIWPVDEVPAPTPAPAPVSFQIVGVARVPLQLDPASGYENLDVLEQADYSRVFAITVRETMDRGPSQDVKLLVAPVLGGGWHIWPPSPLPAEPK
jgi:photosystem II stability/assembly factor-like uncharacterized protein